jgi:hypothetical protein
MSEIDERESVDHISFEILPQPDDTTCGPACLHAVYRHHGDGISLSEVVGQIRYLEEGGTLAVLLARHALDRGYAATIYSYNLQVFDPTWFELRPKELRAKIEEQHKKKRGRKLRMEGQAFVEFLDRGGRLRFEDLSVALLRKYLKRGVPIITGLSATYLHRSARELPDAPVTDDVRGEPVGHFVVLHGYDPKTRSVYIADPLRPNPLTVTQKYRVGIDRVICSILLGILTYDGNLLVIERKK